MDRPALAKAKADLGTWIRKAHGVDHELWLRLGLPPRSGLPPLGVLVEQILGTEEDVQSWLKDEQAAYVAFVKAHPPTKEPIRKAALADLPIEATLTYHHWLEEIPDRGGASELSAQRLTELLAERLAEALGQGAMAARASMGLPQPGFATLTVAQARKVATDIAPLRDGASPEGCGLYRAVHDHVGTPGISAGVLRDGAGRVVGAASWQVENDLLEVQHLGALETACPGVGVQLIRELAGLATMKGAGLALSCPPQSVGTFEALGFVSGVAKADEPLRSRVTLPADKTAKLAQTVPSSPGWASTGFLEGPGGTVAAVDEGTAATLQGEIAGWEGIRSALAEAMLSSAGQKTYGAGPVLALRGAEGKLLALAQYSLREGTDTMRIEGLVASPDAGPGAGRQMMRELATIAAKENRGMDIDQPTTGAIGFYERIGMSRRGKGFTFSPEQAATFATGLTGSAPFGAPVSFAGQVSWELAVAGAEDFLRASTIKGIVDEVTATTHQALVGALADGLARGESTDTIALRVQHLDTAFGPARAQRLARTEVLTATRAGGYQMGSDAGCTSKKWRAQMGPRTRPWHAEANGQTVPYDQPFKVASSKGDVQELMYPGDRSRGATADQIVNCRCSFDRIRVGVSDEATLAKPNQHGTDASTSAPGPVVAEAA